MTEHEINAWQKLAHACFHGGKPWGGMWTLRLVGQCPVTARRIEVTVRGETLEEVRLALLEDATLNALIREPRVAAAISAARKLVDKSSTQR